MEISAVMCVCVHVRVCVRACVCVLLTLHGIKRKKKRIQFQWNYIIVPNSLPAVVIPLKYHQGRSLRAVSTTSFFLSFFLAENCINVRRGENVGALFYYHHYCVFTLFSLSCWCFASSFVLLGLTTPEENRIRFFLLNDTCTRWKKKNCIQQRQKTN